MGGRRRTENLFSDTPSSADTVSVSALKRFDLKKTGNAKSLKLPGKISYITLFIHSKKVEKIPCSRPVLLLKQILKRFFLKVNTLK